jgi:tetratricopeptide (TPR) repeat protein
MRDEQTEAQFREAYGRALATLQLGNARDAEAQLRVIQAHRPGEANSLRVLGIALLAQGRSREAVEALEVACRNAPTFGHALADLGGAYLAEKRYDAAEKALCNALVLDDTLCIAWRRLGDALVELDRYAEALAAFDRSAAVDPERPRLDEAAAALANGDRRRAEGIFRELLRVDSNNVNALCGLATISLGAGFANDSERLLRHALKQSPNLPLIWRGLAQTLLDAGRYAEAETAVRHALKTEPNFSMNWVLLGTICARRLRGDAAVQAFDRALLLDPDQLRVLLSKGHVLKTLGQRTQCEAVYHSCLNIRPDFAEAYCSLADLKTYIFSDTEITAMRALIEAKTMADTDVGQLHFALGRAFEQRGDYGRSFSHYAAGNAERRREATYDAAAFELKSRRAIQIFNASFLAANAGSGCPDPAPIFIVGLPRSGSTLVEQILASHPDVEGTMELPNLATIVRELDRVAGARDRYPESVARMSAEQLRALGARYIEETRDLRADRARFIDKLPNNFSHVGLLHLILPSATVIDVRRHPMDACFSTFKQYFAQGQSFSYDLEDLGRYYRTYLELMDHWQVVLPGKVLSIQYETLVRDAESQIRRLLEHCGLPFAPACLRFHETERSVRTASSEQVRQPIYASSIGHWRHYEAQLAPLKWSLGAALERFRSVTPE